ncbi:tyrosyl-DNA phosphodiesterase 2 [Mytilus galloprovincialis]|uniref:Tyrosyl-DNA phosphodiesterase 2 n=1 Tax=Mytilus galloprovincialis TaxID=29158 RepID=A0A8B6BUI1_MYTGA|nr:tyrosyl-DNA phosphodiesterase 2 [Mytilus galloprovincialis]
MEKPSKKDVELVNEIMKHKGKMVLDSDQFMLIKTTPIPLPKVVSLSNLLELAKNSMIRIQETYNENTNKCYDNPEFLKCSELLQEVLSSLSYYDFSLERSEMIKEIEQYEKDFKIIEIFSEVSTDLLKIRDDTEFPGMQGENIKSLNTLLSYLVHTAEDDRDLCYKIAQLPEFLKAASEKLGQWREPYFSRRSEQLTEGEGIIELLCRLLYIVTMFEENIQRIRDVKCIEVMTPYLNCDDNGIRLLSLAVLSNIANAPEIQTLKSNDDIIKYLVWAVSMALKTECEVWDIWSLTELAKIVKQVARNDTNRGLLVQHGVVPLLVEIAEQGETDEQYEAVCSLSNLLLDKHSKSQMIETKHWKIIEILEKLAKSPEEAVQNISKEALCTLHNNQTQSTECLQEITSEESNGKQSISDEESSPEEIKLLSWNIEGLSSVNIKERTGAVIAFINSERPDVIFLQEVIVDTLEMLSRKCLDYTFIESAVESYFTVIMVKHKVVQVTDSKIIPFTSSTQGRTLQKVECTIKGLSCLLMTSHLESMKTNSDERKHQMKRALHHVVNASRDRTVLFGGDFNIKDREIREMKGLPKGVLDLWIETGRNKETQFTWDTSINTNQTWVANQDFKPKIRFDRIYMRHPKTEPVISPVSFQLIGQEKIPTCDCFPSDHWGILVHFDINKSNTK